jgi:hypothetical protein
MTKSSVLAVLNATIIGCVVGCGRQFPTTPTEPLKPVTTFKIAGNPNLTAIGETRQLTAMVTHADGVTEDVTKGTMWQISDGSIGNFGSPGLLTAKTAGETIVTARYTQKSDSMHIVVLPTGTHILSGTVHEPGFVVAGATVEILDGPSAGLSKITDGGGGYKFYGLSGVFTVRVRKDGYLAQTQQISIAQDQAVDFTLMPMQLPVGIPPGTYRATFAASPSCSQLPDDARSRTYVANLAQDGARLDITLSGPGLNGGRPPTEVRFSGRIVDKTVTFQMASSYYYYYYYYFSQSTFTFGPNILLEQLTSTRYFSLFGTAKGTITGSSITGAIAGTFLSIDAPNGLNKPGVRTIVCAKSDHQFTFNASGGDASRRRR